MEEVIIGFGSNLGDRIKNIRQAINMIQESLGEVKQISSFYESEPWGFESQEIFVNGVLIINTLLSPEQLLKGLKKIEQNLGRKEKTLEAYNDREIDLDILYFGDKVISLHCLDIPHPHIYKRRFVLEPIFEIAPNFVDVRVSKTITELLNACTDASVLKKIVF